jgi:hypothetical protein
MPRPLFVVTFDVVTPESAEQGDVAAAGFIRCDGHVALLRAPMRLRDALRHVSPQCDSGRWWSEVDPRRDYGTGAEDLRALHPPRGITPSSYARISRLLRAD